MKLDEGTAHSFAARGSHPIALHHNRNAPSNSVGTSTELAWNTPAGEVHCGPSHRGPEARVRWSV
ncbi:hypothetical protein M407DRAFT_242644, partial [Tulasnella calospora MUT 4182]